MDVSPGHGPVSCERAIIASLIRIFRSFSDSKCGGCFPLAWMAIQRQQIGLIGAHRTNRLAYGLCDDKHANAMI
jgi:hypothetical protein